MEISNDVVKLQESMLILNNAIKRVSESWNDTVSSAIQVNHINEIISLSNQTNVKIGEVANLLNSKFRQLEEIKEKCSRMRF